MTKYLRYIVLLAMSCVWFGPVAAQDADQPIIETSFDETEVIVGQPIQFRITVLVPTWLSKPIEFPPFEAPDLLVKRFEKSTTPTSRSIDGETWSGVTRVYRISPLVSGTVEIPQQPIKVLWAEPGKTEPIETTLSTEAFQVSGIIPAEAADMSPFIAANNASLTQEISSETKVLKPGDSLTRTLTLNLEGASPFALPQLIPDDAIIPGLATYHNEPVIEEAVKDGWLSGSRTESVTLVAESGGAGTLPSITMEWFNLETKQIETLSVDGFDISVDAPVARDRPPLNPRKIAMMLVISAVVLASLFFAYRFFAPRLRKIIAQRKATVLASEKWAYDQVSHALASRNYTAFVAAFDVWKTRIDGLKPQEDATLMQAIANLGSCLYGNEKAQTDAAWHALSKVMSTSRQLAQQHKQSTNKMVLAPINPTLKIQGE